MLQIDVVNVHLLFFSVETFACKDRHFSCRTNVRAWLLSYRGANCHGPEVRFTSAFGFWVSALLGSSAPR